MIDQADLAEWAIQRKREHKLIRLIHEYEYELRRDGVRGHSGGDQKEKADG